MTDKLELKSCHEVVDTVDVANIESIFHGKQIDPDILTVVMKDGKRLYCDEVCPMQEEPVSEMPKKEAIQNNQSLIVIERTWKVPNPRGGDKLNKIKRKVFDCNDKEGINEFVNEKSKISGYEWSDVEYKYIKL